MNAKTSECDFIESQQNKNMKKSVLSSENNPQDNASQFYTPAVYSLLSPSPAQSLFKLADNASRRVTPVPQLDTKEMRSSVTHSYGTDRTLWHKFGIYSARRLPFKKPAYPKKEKTNKTVQHEETGNKDTKPRLLSSVLIFLLVNVICAGVYRVAVDSAHLHNPYNTQNVPEKLPDKSELMRVEKEQYPHCKMLVHEANKLKQEMQKLKAELNALKNEIMDVRNIAATQENHDVLSEIFGPDVDYALELSGGRIVSTLDTPTYGYQYVSLSLFGIDLFTFGAKTPYVTIQGGLLQPGDCWAFKGTDGKLSIELAKKIYITAVTIEHLPQTYLIQESVKAAPRHFTVYGVFSDCCTKVMLGKFEYLNDGHYRQTFYIDNSAVVQRHGSHRQTLQPIRSWRQSLKKYIEAEPLDIKTLSAILKMTAAGVVEMSAYKKHDIGLQPGEF